MAANSFIELSVTAAGTTSDWLMIDDAPALWNGRHFGLIYVEGTGSANGTVQIECQPNPGSSSVIIGSVEAFAEDLTITATKRTLVADFNAQRGMRVRINVKTYSGSGSLNCRIDLGIS